MIRLITVLLLLVGLTSSAVAASPDPKSLIIPSDELSRARELVQQLGSEQFAEREKAEIALARMGRFARPALVEAANTDPNQEIRTRCTSLLPKATALEIRARLDVFLADADGKFEHDLPGWNQFRSTIRNEWELFGYTIWSDRKLDAAARRVFAELIATTVNRQIVMAAGDSQQELGALVAARRQELYYQKYPRAIVVGGAIVRPTGAPREPSPEDIAALLFADSLVASKFVPRAFSVTALITSSGFAALARDSDDKGKVYRSLAVAWLESRQDPIDMYQCMTVASTLGLPEQCCRIGVRLLTMPGAAGSYRGIAATNLARLGDKSIIPQLEKALADATVAMTLRENIVGKPINERPMHDVQVKDMALAVSVILSGQKIEDYGFIDNLRANGGVSGVPTTYTYSRHYIPEDKRKEMHAKWKEWRQMNP